MFLEGPLWDAACDNAFADHVPFFVTAIEHLTGYVVFYIDGPQRPSRRNVFGLVGRCRDLPTSSAMADMA